MSVDRHCDKCNLEVPRGTVLTTLCVDGMAHHLVDNIIPAPAVPGNYVSHPMYFIVLFPSHILHIYILFAFDEFYLSKLK